MINCWVLIKSVHQFKCWSSQYMHQIYVRQTLPTCLPLQFLKNALLDLNKWMHSKCIQNIELLHTWCSTEYKTADILRLSAAALQKKRSLKLLLQSGILHKDFCKDLTPCLWHGGSKKRYVACYRFELPKPPKPSAKAISSSTSYSSSSSRCTSQTRFLKEYIIMLADLNTRMASCHNLYTRNI